MLVAGPQLVSEMGKNGVSENFRWATVAPKVEQLIINEAERQQ
jgi:hypothetical protein